MKRSFFETVAGFFICSLTIKVSIASFNNFSPTEIITPDLARITSFYVATNIFEFKVRSPEEAHILLRSPDGLSKWMVYLGCYGNTKSLIVENDEPTQIAETTNILSAFEYRGFWIKWFQNLLLVGRDSSSQPFLRHASKYTILISSIGIATGLHPGPNVLNPEMGSWIIGHSSPPVTISTIPFVSQVDIYGAVPQLEFQTLSPTQSDIQYINANQPVSEFFSTAPLESNEINHKLPTSPCWVSANNGILPANALEAGFDYKEEHFVCRVQEINFVIPGDLAPTQGSCLVAINDKVIAYEEYEVYCCPMISKWLPVRDGNVPEDIKIPGGLNSHGNVLYICRAEHRGNLIIGNVNGSICCIAFDNSKYVYKAFDILISDI